MTPNSILPDTDPKIRRALDAIAFLQASIAAGSVYNVDFNEAKDHINYGIDRDRDALWIGRCDAVEALPTPHRWDVGSVPYYAHELPTYAKRVAAAKKACPTFAHPGIDAFLERWLPAADVVKAAKPLLIKGRKPSETPRKTEERTLENTGTCAICGKNVKRDADGTLADHGFTIQWHGRNGNCYGCRFQPLEVSPEGLVAMRGLLDERLRKLGAWIAKAKRGEIDEVQVDRYPRPVTYTRKDKEFDRYLLAEIASSEGDFRWATRQHRDVCTAIENWEPTTLPGIKAGFTR